MTVALKVQPPDEQRRVRQTRFRKRFLFVGIGALAILGPMLGVSFLGDSGTAATSVTGSVASSLVYTSTVPCDIFGTNTVPTTLTLEHTTTASTTPSSCSSPVTAAFKSPSWSPAANSAGAVSTAGDVALVDMSAEPSATNAIVNVYTTNLQGLGSDYSSFAFPINVYSCPTADATATSACNTWTAVTNALSYITNTNGSYSISLPGGAYYDITIDTGGEYYCISTNTTSPATLAPQFFVTAQLS